MVCSCAMSSNSVWLKVWLQIIFCTCVKETVVSSFLRSLLRENGRLLRFPMIFIKKKQTRWSNDKTIIELGYCKISWFLGQLFAEAELICSPERNHDIYLDLVQLLLSIWQFIQAWFFFQTSCYYCSKLARLQYYTSMTWLQTSNGTAVAENKTQK